MSSTVLYMSMSLDGFVAGPNEHSDNGLGDGGERLHEWVFVNGGSTHRSDPPPGVNGEVFRECLATGAVVCGRGTFEPADGWSGDHHDDVPIFVLSRHAPPEEHAHWPNVTYLDDIVEIVRRAKAAAGDRNVLVHGVGTARRALVEGVLDELEIHVVPVLFGQGRRLFEGLPAEQVELERVRALEGEGGVMHLRYRVAGRGGRDA